MEPLHTQTFSSGGELKEMREGLANINVLNVLTVLGVLLLAFFYACNTDNKGSDSELRCVEPLPGARAELCDDINDLDFAFPADISDPNGVEVQKQYDCLSWLTFIALNWPAEKGCRGVPDRDAPFTKSGGPRVWETYKAIFEIFQSQDPFWDPSDQKWNDSPQAIECSGMANGKKITHRTTKAPIGQNVENEFLEALSTGFGTLTDQAGNLLRYEVRLNRDIYEFIIDNGYAITGNYSYNGPITSEGLFLPDNTTGFTGQGTMEIKAAWKVLTEQDDPKRYYTSEAVIFDPESSTPCSEATLGLVGLHITHKNFNAPQWVWATFEHVDNVPPLGSNGDGRQYTLFSESCAAAEPDNCWSFQQPIASEEFRCCSNLELNPRVFPMQTDDTPGTPNQATRLNPLRDSGLNAKFQKILADAGSPFQYYVLVGSEYPEGGRDPENSSKIRTRPCKPIGAVRVPPVSENCYTQIPGDLRNTSMETYMASFGEGTEHFSSDSCLNCHGAVGANFSFIWLDAMTNIVPLK